MNKERMRKVGKIILIESLVIVLAIAALGCDIQSPPLVSSENQSAFITDRVVEVRIVMKERDWDSCWVDARAERYVPADFWFDGEFVPGVAVRPKGSSSLLSVCESGSSRLSLKVDFNRLYPSRTFRGLKKLNYHNGFRDPTLIREHLAYEVFTQMGVPAARTSHVDLWINDTHLGLYTQVEQVDRTFLKRHFGRDDGNLYKPILPASYLNWTKEELIEQRDTLLHSQTNNPGKGQEAGSGNSKFGETQPAIPQDNSTTIEVIIDEPTSEPPKSKYSYLDMMILKTNEGFPDHTNLFRLLDVINSELDETSLEEIEKVLDVDEVLRFIAVSVVVGSLDSYLGFGQNYYLYEIDGRFTIIPWDLNESFGTFKCGMSRKNAINLYIDEPTCGPLSERPLIKQLLSHQSYLDTYHGYLESLLNGPFEINKMKARIDEVASLVRPYVDVDELKFFSNEEFERNLTHDVGHHIGLKNFVVEHSDSIRQQLEGNQPSAGDGSGNKGR